MGGQHKSKASIAAGKRNAAKQKKSGKGIFKPVTLSAALSKVTGINGKTTRGQVFKALWAYIKKKAKKPKKKKKKKKKAKKKKKKRKKKKAKKARLGPNGKRAKGQHKSKASIAAGKKNAAKQ